MSEKQTVAAVEDMPDENFHKHLELRHLPQNDWGGLKTLRGGEQFSNNWKVYAMWHAYCHSNWPGSYDHQHAE